MRAPRPCLALLLALAAPPLLGACAGPSYYAQAVSGHLSLMNSRRPVETVLRETDPGEPLAERLATARSMLAFAASELGLPPDGSYRSYAPTPKDAVTWNVVVTPEYSLEAKRWCFPVAGCVPYRGYFDREAADRFAERMRARSRDVAVSGATAYSTLGWFDDPLTDTMLSASDAQLADTLFHELAHQALYVSGDSRFNESYATFVAREGVRAWMRAEDDEAGLARWESRRTALRRFLELLAETRGELTRLYASQEDEGALAAGKARAFDTLVQRYETLVRETWDGRDRFAGWFEPAPNNADLALVGTYTDGLCAFQGLWTEADGDFDTFHALARRMGAKPRAERRSWLKTPCAGATRQAGLD